MENIDLTPFIKREIELNESNYRQPLGIGFILFSAFELILFGIAIIFIKVVS